MLRRALVISFLLGTSPALADEVVLPQGAASGPTQAQSLFLNKALAALQQQRNTAMDDAVDAHALAALQRDQLAQQKTALAELNAWIDAAKPKIPPEMVGETSK